MAKKVTIQTSDWTISAIGDEIRISETGADQPDKHQIGAPPRVSDAEAHDAMAGVPVNGESYTPPEMPRSHRTLERLKWSPSTGEGYRVDDGLGSWTPPFWNIDLSQVPTSPMHPKPASEIDYSKPPKMTVLDHTPPPAGKTEDAEALLAEGMKAFEVLTRIWIQNFEGTGPQPDRQNALVTAFSGYGRASRAYIYERGGLAGAVTDTLLRCAMVPPDEAVKLGKKIALNMVPVGTVMGFEIDKLLEKSLYLSRDAGLDDSVPRGGVAEASINFTRPGYDGVNTFGAPQIPRG
jgi:hypothetical protein